MKKTKVIFIAADKCEDCVALKKKVLSTLDDAGIKYDTEVLDYASERAISLAIAYGLDTLPSFIINKTGFNGNPILKEVILNAAKVK